MANGHVLDCAPLLLSPFPEPCRAGQLLRHSYPEDHHLLVRDDISVSGIVVDAVGEDLAEWPEPILGKIGTVNFLGDNLRALPLVADFCVSREHVGRLVGVISGHGASGGPIWLPAVGPLGSSTRDHLDKGRPERPMVCTVLSLRVGQRGGDYGEYPWGHVVLF